MTKKTHLDSLGAREETAVDGIHDGLGANLATAEEAAVETLDGVFAALHRREFEVDVALRVGVEGNVHDVAVLLFALGTDVFFELLDPGIAFLAASICQLVLGA